jgi:hypothetical protein
MRAIIAQIGEYFKVEFLLRFFWVICVSCLLLLAFFLGRVTKFLENSPTFTFESKEQEEENFQSVKNKLFGAVSTSTIVASKGGKKYYYVWCSGANNIKESNKRYFANEQAAEKAGYSLANNCK